MPQIKITCDRAEGLIRCAVWKGKDLVDLYVDRADAPDMSGAVARGKIVRVSAGGAVAWVDAGLPARLYVESKDPLKNGAIVTVRIKSTLGQGKAWSATLVKDNADVAESGLIVPPPFAWERALDGLAKGDSATLTFGSIADFEMYQDSPRDGVTPVLNTKEPVHPDIAELIDQLCDPVVTLSGGASLVIEQTQALVAIDVNGGEATNAAGVNLQAVREAARQIRLRNLSGIIVIDCLKMKDRADTSKVVNAFTRVAEGDPAKVHVYGISKLGLLEVTRERHGPALDEIVRG